MAKMSFSSSSLGGLLSKKRETLVSLVLLGVLLYLGWHVYQEDIVLRTDPDAQIKEVLEKHGYQDPRRGANTLAGAQYDQILSYLLQRPEEEPFVRAVVRNDPFTPAEITGEIQEAIRQLLAEARDAMNQRNWSVAIEVLERVLEKDPSEVRVDYGDQKPSQMLAEAERELTKLQMDRNLQEGESAFAQGQDAYQSQELRLARDYLVTARDSFQNVLQLDPERRLKDEAYFGELQSRIEECNRLIFEINEDLLPNEVDEAVAKATQHLDSYQESSMREVMELAMAKVELVGVIQKVEDVDPQLRQVDAQKYQQILNMRAAVDDMVDQVLPQLGQQIAEALKGAEEARAARNADQYLAQLDTAHTLLEVMVRIQPDNPDVKIQLDEVRAEIEVERGRDAQRRVREMLERARAMYDRALRSKTAGNQTRLREEREAGLTVLEEIEGMRDTLPSSALPEDVEREVGNLRNLFAGLLEDLPSIEGAKLMRIYDSRSALIAYKGKTVRHTLGRQNIQTGLTLVEVKETGQPPYATVEAEGFEQTRINLEP